MSRELNFRIFLSYRGNSEGKIFEYELYNYFKEDPFWKERYGEIYFSPITDPTGNFKDIKPIMKNVEFFVIPLTANFFDDFWDNNNKCPNEESITYKEITEAIENNVHFICVAFDGFTMDTHNIKRIFGNNSDIIDGAKLLEYNTNNKEELFMSICNITLRNEMEFIGIHDIINHTNPNVELSFKSKTEDKNIYPFYHKLYDVKSITLLNYAASSFISGIDIAQVYKETDSLKRWFSYNLSKGNIIANIILTDPLSAAANDAAQYKMFPENTNTSSDEIILHNMNKLFEFMNKNPNAKLNVYLTKIALPYGIMMTEHQNSKNNHMKVDLYSPVIERDGNRPSFYLLENNDSTSHLYNFFRNNIIKIKNSYSYSFKGHPSVEWMKNPHKHIIHRGVLSEDFLPHTKKSFAACIEAKLPIEVDLFSLKDGTIIVGREEETIKYNNTTVNIRDCHISDIRIINKQIGENQILTLTEFLDLVSGKIPVILEIKTKIKSRCDDRTNESIEQISKIVTNYLRKCSAFFSDNYNSHGCGVAIHSSNPYVLKRIKEINCMIPCGIISSDFSNIAAEVGEDFVKLHNEAKYLEFFEPDFISYNVEHLKNGLPHKIKARKEMPLLGWTIKNEDDQFIAEDYLCDNIIIEGAKNYI